MLHEALVYMVLRGDKLLVKEYNFILKDSSQPPTRTSTPSLFLQLT